MLFPNDEIRSNAFLAGIVVGGTASATENDKHMAWLKNVWKANAVKGYFTDFASKINSEASFNVIRDVLQPFGGVGVLSSLTQVPQITEADLEERWCRGYLAGSVMNIIGYLDQINPPASVNKAIFIEEHHLENKPVCPGNIGKSDKVIWKAWAEFKPALHLWGACCYWATRVDNDDQMSWLNSQENFLFFLDIARWFEGVGCSIIPKGKREPILDERSLWKIPEELISSEIVMCCEEEKWITDLLGTYHAPKRFI
jgi:hypothetical protein